MVVQELTDANGYETLLADHKDELVVLDFYATWCGPCKMMAPKFLKLSNENQNVIFAKVDVDEAEEIVSRFDIKVMPTFVFMKAGVQIDIVEGSVEEELRSKIAQHQ